jgi:hypothetical protein
MRAMFREKRSMSTDGCDGTAGGADAAGGGAGGAAGALAVVFSSMRFLPERLVLRTLVLGFVILFGINLFEAILIDTDVVVHCSVNLTC